METTELLAELKAVRQENKKRFDGLQAQIDEVEQASVSRRGSGGFNGGNGEWGAAISQHEKFKAWREGGMTGKARIPLVRNTVTTITTGSTSGGPMVAPDVRTDPVALARQRVTVRSLLAPGRTDSGLVEYPRQITRQNNAAPVAEGVLKPQSDFTMQMFEEKVRTIAHFTQASRQIMDDAKQMQSFIDAELRYGLQIVEEAQLLTGNNTGENLNGLIPQATAYSPPVTVDDESPIDTILLALIQAELNLYPADGVVINTSDWGQMRLVKNTQGNYVLGNPAAATPPVLWGVPLVVTPSITAGTFLTGAFYASAQIFDRLDPEVLLSTESGNNFVQNEVTIRAEERLALAVKRPQGLITGSFPTVFP